MQKYKKIRSTPVGLEPTASEYLIFNQLEVRRAIHCATEPLLYVCKPTKKWK